MTRDQLLERRGAVISADELYRYDLERWWGNGPGVLWIMLNPSTADADFDDPTIRRCRGFTKAMRHSGFGVVNLYGLRTTKPEHLLDHPDPVGPLNERFVDRWLRWNRITTVIAAWGAGASALPDMAERAEMVRGIASAFSRQLWCLGKTKDGAPRHPLYLKADSELDEWRRS